MKTALLLTFFLFTTSIGVVWAQKQHLGSDTTLARKWYVQALALQDKGQYANSNELLSKASFLYQKHRQWAQQISCDNLFSYGLYKIGSYQEALQKAEQTLRESLNQLGQDNPQVAGSYTNIALVWQAQGEYNKALEYLQQALQIHLKTYSAAQPKIADSYSNFGNVYFEKGEYEKALEYHQQALQSYLKIFGEVHPSVANSYHSIGNVYYARGEYNKALSYYQKSLPIRRTVLGEVHPSVAYSYNNMGNIYHLKGKYDKSLEYHLQALQIRRAVLGEAHPKVADSYSNIGKVHQVKGEYEKALEYQQQALQNYVKTFGAAHPSVSDSYDQLGHIYYNKAEYEKALAYYQQALPIRRTAFGEMHPSVAYSYNHLGNIFYEKGEYAKALEYHQKALQIRRTVLSEAHPSIANSYHNIANVYYARGEYDKALEYHQKALQIRRTALGEAHPSVAISYNNMGNAYYVKGEYDKSLEYHQKGLQIRRTVLGEAHPKVADSYINIGKVHQVKGEYEKALEYQQRALQNYLKTFGAAHPSVSESYNQLGKVHQVKGEYEKALDYYQKALQIRRTALGETHPSVAIAFNNLGTVYHLKGAYKKALQQFQHAILANITSFRDTLTAHNPILTGQTGPYLNSKALLTSLQAKAQTFEQRFTQSHTITDLLLAYQTSCSADSLAQKIQRNYDGESDKVAFTASAMELYQQALPLCLKLYRLTQEQTYLNKAFYFAERGKASVLSASLAESQAKTFAGIPDSLLQQDQGFRTQIARYSQRLAEELTKGDDTDSSKLQNYQNQLFAAHRQQESLISKFEKAYPQYFALKYQPTTVTPQQLQSILDNKTALLEYVLADTVLRIFIITPDFFDVRSIPLDSLFRRQLAAFREGILYNDLELYQQVAHRLYQVLLPASLPKSIKSLIIIPAGELTSLPFEALLTQAKKVKFNKPKNYLLNKYTISYAYSARLLHERLIQPKETVTKQLLALAPVFTGSSNQIMAATTRSFVFSNQPVAGIGSTRSKAGSAITTRTILHSFPEPNAGYEKELFATSGEEETLPGHLLDGQYVPPLLASEREVATIAKLFRAKKAVARVYLHQQAREEQLKRLEASGYNYVHLATHGFVNDDYPELSGLLLAQDSTSQEDGILYTGEIYNLRLKADLVTLSACDTGLGKLARGEGVIGLTRALLYAGARNIIVSLWKVSDTSTADFMAYFYQELLSGLDKAEALQAAKRKLIRKGKYSLPFYWAPFILIGK